MEHFKIASAIIDYNNNILKYNHQFAKLFLCTIQNKKTNGEHLKLHHILNCDLSLDTHSTGLLIINRFLQSQCMLGYFYVHKKQLGNTYQIQFTNWLNWLANLYDSIDINYNNMININNSGLIEVEQSSDIHAFNAFYPLLIHRSHDSVNQISTNTLHGVLRKFINRKTAEYISKDYAKCTYRRLETSFKEQTGQLNLTINDIMSHRNKIQFKHLGEIYIPNTKIKQNLLIHGYTDELLNLYLSALS